MYSGSNGTNYEAVLFIDHDQVVKEMLYSEFEAVLDNVVGIPEFVNRECRAAYIKLTGQLNITAVVLFTIEFDKEGLVDRNWNLPLRHMAEIAGAGPDMGAGPIRLACRSQCPVPWHQRSMWDPTFGSPGNTLTVLRESIRRNRLAFIEEPPQQPMAMNNGMPQAGNAHMPMANQSPPMYQAPQGYPPGAPQNGYYNQGYPQPGSAAPYPQQSQIPVGNGQAPGAPPILQGQQPPADFSNSQNQQHIPVVYPGNSAPSAEPPMVTNQEQNEFGLKERKKAAVLIKNLRLQLAMLETKQKDELNNLMRQHADDTEDLQKQMNQALQALELERSRNGQLKEKLTEQAAEFQLAREEYLDQVDEAKALENSQLVELAKKYELEFKAKIEAETSELKEMLDMREVELFYREEQISSLREEVASLRHEKQRLLSEGGDNYLEKLGSSGITFVAFHPGAGHLTIPLADAGRYLESPTAYVAEKCFVSEERYLQWLDHYQNPICCETVNESGNPVTADKPGAHACGENLQRVDSPNHFIAGRSDRCNAHRGLVELGAEGGQDGLTVDAQMGGASAPNGVFSTNPESPPKTSDEALAALEPMMGGGIKPCDDPNHFRKIS